MLTLGLLLVSGVSHLMKGLDFEEASLALGLFLLLVLLRNQFHALSDPPSVRQGLVTLAAAFGFTLLYGSAGFYILDRHFSEQFNLLSAIRQTVLMFSEFYNPGLQPITGFGRYFAFSIYLIGLATLGFALLMLIRPVLIRQPATSEEKARAGKIIQQYGRTSLTPAAMFDDKSYFFSGDDTVIAYAERGRGAMALGDPIGPPNQAGEAIANFSKYCSRKDWTPAFVSIMPDSLDQYRAAGFEAIHIGYEAIINLGDFSLEGSKNKDLRNAFNRMERGGYRAEIHQPPLDGTFVNALRQISDAWLAGHKGGEMRFSDGWFDDRTIRNSQVIAIYGKDGPPVAFATLVKEFQNNEMTIDLMRHYPRVENGTMEYLFIRMLQWAKEAGYSTFSLGMSAISGVGIRPDDPTMEKALHLFSAYSNRFVNFKGLHAFKDKFHPQWEPRYLAYPGAASLPLVINTLIKVHSAEGSPARKRPGND